jgi:hypothetical protein
MAQAGTLISDLGSDGTGQDDIVQKILADMNSPAMPQGHRPPPPPMPAPTPMYQQQMATSTMPMTMDGQIPTSHMIGNQHPTPADFAAAVTGVTGQRQAEYMMNGAGMGPMMPGYTAAPPSKNFYGKVLDEIKIPLIVALIVFGLSLPPVRVLISHYLPSLIAPSGQFTVVGLAGISLVGGLVFWILNRIIAPLLSF